MIKKYKVSLLGETYTIVSDESEEHVALCVQRVNEMMNTLTESLSITDSKRAAVLLALQLMSKVSQLESRYQEKHQEHLRLIDLIDRELADPLF